MKKRTILTILSCVLVAVVSVMGTLAYLTDSESVENTFTIGQVDIVLDEADVDENGNLRVDAAGNPLDRVTENEYHLLPGQEYIKDPTITVQPNSEESYVRMIMTVHNASAVQAIIDKHQLGDFSALIKDWDAATWFYKGFTADTAANTISFEFRYKETVAAEDTAIVLEPLFKKLVVPAAVDGEELKKLYDPNEDGNYEDGFKMVITGHAIQAAGFEKADDAWTAFETQTTK